MTLLDFWDSLSAVSERLFKKKLLTLKMTIAIIIIILVIVISKFLGRLSKAKRRAPDYSRALRQIT